MFAVVSIPQSSHRRYVDNIKTRNIRPKGHESSGKQIFFFPRTICLQDPDDREVRIHRGGVLLCVQDRNMSEELIQSHLDAFAIKGRGKDEI